MIGCELWEINFEFLFVEVKTCITDLWPVSVNYGDSGSNQSYSHSSTGDLRNITVHV